MADTRWVEEAELRPAWKFMSGEWMNTTAKPLPATKQEPTEKASAGRKAGGKTKAAATAATAEASAARRTAGRLLVARRGPHCGGGRKN